jgi:hypothetical protein
MSHVKSRIHEEPAVSSHLRTRALAPLALASLLTLGLTGGVLGKCNHDPEAECPAGVVAIIDGNGSLTAGTSETIAVWLHDGEEPFLADAVNVVFTRVGDGTSISVIAAQTELDGRWEATVELPAGGTWAVAAEVTGQGYSGVHPMDALQVEPPAAPPAGVPAAATPVPVLPWLGLVALAALAAGIGGLIAVTRRRQATIQG